MNDTYDFDIITDGDVLDDSEFTDYTDSEDDNV